MWRDLLKEKYQKRKQECPGLTLKVLSERSEVSEGSLEQLFYGRYIPAPATLFKVMKALDMGKEEIKDVILDFFRRRYLIDFTIDDFRKAATLKEDLKTFIENSLDRNTAKRFKQIRKINSPEARKLVALIGDKVKPYLIKEFLGEGDFLKIFK